MMKLAPQILRRKFHKKEFLDEKNYDRNF